jgi:hypothetical protein
MIFLFKSPSEKILEVVEADEEIFSSSLAFGRFLSRQPVGLVRTFLDQMEKFGTVTVDSEDGRRWAISFTIFTIEEEAR